MSAVAVKQMADRVAGLMEERLRIRGATLSDKLGRGGRLLPRRVRSSARLLADAAERAGNPRLAAQLDHARIAAAYDDCLRHLQPIGSAARVRNTILDASAMLAAVAIVTAALVISVLVWRGYL